MPRKSSKRKPKAKPGRKPRRRFVYWTALFAFWLVMVLAISAAYVILTLPHQASLALPKRAPGVTVLARDGRMLARRGGFAGDDVQLDQLPSFVPQAVIAIEDRRFYGHFGIDPVGFLRAVFINLKAGRLVQGGSTITQQLAKNLFLKPERTLKRKYFEALLAVWLEYKFTKREILQLYLNRVYFGSGAYGIEAAAKRYYDKPAALLTLPQAAVLAGLLKAPNRFAPNRHKARAEIRAYVVLNNMVKAGYITQRQGQYAVNNPARAKTSPRLAGVNYAVDWVIERLPDFAGRPRADLIVDTTIDPVLQKAANRAITRNLARYGAKLRVSQAALVALAPNGEIRALVGGLSYAKSQFNRAIKARRQPGSAFKPFVYLTALERGLTPDSMRRDAPIRLKRWRPRNYTGRYLGPVTLRDSLAHSINTVAVRLALEVGPQRVAKTARRLGISSPIAANPSLALGTSEVSLMELTSAYVPFANGGFGVIPHIITSIRTRDGRILYRRAGSGPGRIVNPAHVGAMNDMMRQTLISGTGRAARLASRQAAGKTGTSQEFRDAWFIGYTAALIAGVWAGNDDGKPTKKVTGGGLPALIWREFMTAVHAGRPAKRLPEAPGANNPIARLLRIFGL
jgi:penicillin-binding protein 1A